MFTLNCRGKLLVIDQPIVMGIINATPDSFYRDSRKMAVEEAVAQAAKMLSEGAAILDIGGQSTRPGAAACSAEQELERVLPMIEGILDRFPDTLLSIDTYHSKVAAATAERGVSIVNDISGGDFDPGMLETVASLRMPFVCMHVKGNATTMHKVPDYTDVVTEVLDHFIHKTEACRQAGINDIIIDPGFGFSKQAAHNFSLLRRLEVFSILGKPILAGLSRKSTIYKTLGITPEASLNGTTVLNTAALLKGASILRVHDVKEALEAVKLIAHLKG
ncbi:dihydropteroate synthase [Sediminibacterium soli]|uniref:dihydropteroate synthase n=1 Tax=Sediminibacterium soli TaxID=2698829 RepID=UPI001379B3D3|nr:dihydropteroate synthase [Sediminibacterium soli]NCI46229.1 dihydropteroate synthase [Sediminibacterium soli]